MPRTALITGGGSGIGRAAAIALAARGFHIALTGRRRQPLEETAHLCGPDTLVLPADLTDELAVERLFASLSQTLRRLDVLFNNAGINLPPTPFPDISLDAWNSVLDVNLTAAFLAARAAFRLMQRQQPQGGRIINNGSISATSPRPYAAAYTASKHAVLGLTKTISLEGRPFHIACGQIDIGNASTALAGHIAAGTLQADLSTRSEPTFDPRHVADAVVYMAELPLDVNVQSLTVMATTMPYIGRG